MSLLSAQELRKTFGPQTILDGVSFSIEAGERVGLVGINGSGKSTLARMLGGLELPDTGLIVTRRDASIAYLSQDPQFAAGLTAREIVLSGLKLWSAAKEKHDQASDALSRGEGDVDTWLSIQSTAGADVDRLGGWDMAHRAESMLDHLGIARHDARVETMSGGERRRVALASILVSRPDLAILDEPTNHLDIDTVEWLERYLVEEHKGALLLITHDRYVLDRAVTRTLEIDRGRVFSYEGGYEEYLESKMERLEQADRAEQNRQNFLRRELDWLRRQPKARTGKQKARIDRAVSARDAPKLTHEGRVRLTVESSRTGKTLLDTRDLQLDIAGRTLVRDFTMSLVKGERIGIVGPNGAGKTTLLRALIGTLQPTAGEIQIGQNTEIAYFDQARSGLDDKQSIYENVSEGKMRVTVNGFTMDTRSWLERFLFDPSKQTQPVGALSGGERARVALAKLLLKPANLIVLDEPTNDLDVATLSSLEELLVEMDGTALVVTHDRYFLDRVATAILAFEGDGRVVKYQGNYTTYRALRDAAAAEKAALTSAVSKSKGASKAPPANNEGSSAKKKSALTYGERLELESLPSNIETTDVNIRKLEEKLADPATYTNVTLDVQALVKELEQKRNEAARLLTRWEELETKKEQSDS
ncbi:MAG: ABC-F family ATP-binding cassette domain-containing protein [Sandaracinaceae bacterium]|nr:ABC-F family ATP-binding cassette domain-containing protein [Sandaracinaceae bacterium]